MSENKPKTIKEGYKKYQDQLEAANKICPLSLEDISRHTGEDITSSLETEDEDKTTLFLEICEEMELYGETWEDVEYSTLGNVCIHIPYSKEYGHDLYERWNVWTKDHVYSLIEFFSGSRVDACPRDPRVYIKETAMKKDEEKINVE